MVEQTSKQLLEPELSSPSPSPKSSLSPSIPTSSTSTRKPAHDLDGQSGSQRPRYVVDRDNDLWQHLGDGLWRCLTTDSCDTLGGDLANICGPLTELGPPRPPARPCMECGHLESQHDDEGECTALVGYAHEMPCSDGIPMRGTSWRTCRACPGFDPVDGPLASRPVVAAGAGGGDHG